MHKIAGALSERGRSLADILSFMRESVLPRMGTIGLSLGPCCPPAASAPSFSLAGDEAELGLGIHGEAGVSERTDSTLD